MLAESVSVGISVTESVGGSVLLRVPALSLAVRSSELLRVADCSNDNEGVGSENDVLRDGVAVGGGVLDSVAVSSSLGLSLWLLGCDNESDSESVIGSSWVTVVIVTLSLEVRSRLNEGVGVRRVTVSEETCEPDSLQLGDGERVGARETVLLFVSRSDADIVPNVSVCVAVTSPDSDALSVASNVKELDPPVRVSLDVKSPVALPVKETRCNEPVSVATDTVCESLALRVPSSESV
jgi:hypothetical protein